MKNSKNSTLYFFDSGDKPIKNLPFYLLFLTSAVFSNIFEIDRIDEVKSYLEKDTLVLFDIYNTIMHPVQELGRDQWFYHRISQYEDQGFSFSESLERALEEWISILHVTKVSPVESQVASIIDQIQSKNIPLMGLTARGSGVSTITMKQLRTLYINLAKTAPFYTEALVLNPHGVLFRAGILFTAGTNRGISLFKFFDHVGITPKNAFIHQ